MDRIRLDHGLLTGLLVASLVTSCAPAGRSVAPSRSPSPSPSPAGDVFAGLPYRLDLPADWVVLGSPDYLEALDAGGDVAAWLTALDLVGPNAIRAYEPLPAAAGLRLAVNPATPWRSSPPVLRDAGLVEALPGVTGEPIGELVPVGPVQKAGRFRWTQTLDWGSGAPSARSCVGYEVLGEFEPVYVVFSYPDGSERLADVEALMTTFEVLASPVWSLPPGVTMPPSPTPFDKTASEEPAPTFHGDPALEALLPDSVDGVALTKQSQTGEQMGMSASDPILAAFGKEPADLSRASAIPSHPPLLLVGVQRLRGIPADELLAAVLDAMSGATVTETTLGGHRVTYVEAGAWPVWYYASGELLYGVAGMEETVATVLTTLP